MNDSELITAVKESVTGVHMHISTEQIVSRSRTIRARRRIPGVAGALAVVAGVAVAVAALLPASHQPSGQRPAQLAAWTVVKQADGTVSVTALPARIPRSPAADGPDCTVCTGAARFPGVLLSRGPLRACCYRSGSAAAARSRATDPAATRAHPAAILGLRRCTARATQGT